MFGVPSSGPFSSLVNIRTLALSPASKARVFCPLVAIRIGSIGLSTTMKLGLFTSAMRLANDEAP